MTDILIAGGGPGGMLAALALGQTGAEVLLVDPAPIPRADARSTAFLAPSVEFFLNIGLWGDLAGVALPLEALTLVDAAGTPPEERMRRTFRAADHGLEAFAENIPNNALNAALGAALSRLPNVSVRRGVGVAEVFTRTSGAEVTLSDGTRVGVRLVVAADGRNSPLRERAGIAVSRRASGQTAVAFTATHPVPHGNVSTEIYTSGGPCTLVPVRDVDGKPASAVVWMDATPAAEELLALDAADFDAALTRRTLGLLGPMERTGQTGRWKVETLTARSLTGERLVVIGEAAHVLPPIGAQGLNSTVRDIVTLAGLVGGADPGSSAVLDRYARARRADIALRAGAIDVMNRVTSSDTAAMLWLREAGLKLASDFTPLRKSLVKVGLG